MPYAIAHPLAVIPLARAMGRAAVPSALAIGSVIPDAWYLVPGLDRPFSHNASGLVLFCLPAGLLLYLLFHLLLKEPLLSLLPPGIGGRAAAWSSKGLPAASWTMVCICILLGALTHQAWDAFTHAGRLSRGALPMLNAELLGLELYRWLQHASTLLGAALLAGWVLRKLRTAPLPPSGFPHRPGMLLVIVVVGALASLGALAAAPVSFDFRQALRAAAVAGVAAAGAALVLYALLFRLRRGAGT